MKCKPERFMMSLPAVYDQGTEDFNMRRKYLTEIFPFLTPLRLKQRKLFWFAAMRLDGNRYAKEMSSTELPYETFRYTCTMINRQAAGDLQYQYNKAHNLKLASRKISGLLIHPGESFSLCLAIKDADKQEPYQEALIVINDQLKTAKGGGLCQLSNMLYWVFLNSELTVTERHPHRIMDFPDPTMQIRGTDATIASGWLDLKVKNTTAFTYQILTEFAGDDMTVILKGDDPVKHAYIFRNDNTVYERRDGHIYEDTDVLRCDVLTGTERRLYRNHTEIGYPLPAGTVIREGGTDR